MLLVVIVSVPCAHCGNCALRLFTEGELVSVQSVISTLIWLPYILTVRSGPHLAPLYVFVCMCIWM